MPDNSTKPPPSFNDALADAAASIGGSVSSPDYDSKFAGMLLDVISKFVQGKNKPQSQSVPPGAPGAAAQPPAGGPGAPSPQGDGGAGAPGGVGAPPGAGGPGGSGGLGAGAQTPPAAPTPGGMTQGLTPSPDELRRVLADVAGK